VELRIIKILVLIRVLYANELYGHHHDCMTTRSQRQACRGEDYAERYAIRYSRLIWNRYVKEFERR
jgi:hypothetical protein